MNAAGKSTAKRLCPVWAAFGMPLLLIALNATPLGPNVVFVMIGIPLLLGAWLVAGIVALILTIRRVRRREGSLALISAILPLFVLLAGLQLQGFIHLCDDAGDIVYFLAKRSSYMKEVRSAPNSDAPRLLVFDRGGMVWASQGYIYDESDQVIRAASLQSGDWKARAGQTELACGYFARPFPGHFSFTNHWYLASFAC